MEGVELAIPAAVAVPNLMGSEGFGGVRASSAGDAEGRGVGQGLGFAGSKSEKFTGPATQKALQTSSWTKKADTESCRKMVPLSSLAKEDMLREQLYGGSSSNSPVVTAGYEGQHFRKKEGRISRTDPGYFKRPRTPQLESSIFLVEDVNMQDASDELGPNMAKNSFAEKSQPLKHRNSLHAKRGERRNSKVPLKTKHDSVAGFSLAPGGMKVFGTYGLKPDVHDITKLLDNISLKELLDRSCKCATVAREKGKRPANNSENILHLVRKAFSVLPHRGLSQANKQCEEIDVSDSKELSSLPDSSMSMSSNLDADDEGGPVSDLSSNKVHESFVNTNSPPAVSDIPLFSPSDIIKKLTLPTPKDLDSLLQDVAKPATSSRSNDPHTGNPASSRVTLPTFSWSHNYNGHGKSNSDSAKASSRGACQARWVRISKTASFLRNDTESVVDLDSLTYNHSLVPSSSVKYILPEIRKTVYKMSAPLNSEHAFSSALCGTSSQIPPALQSPRAMAAALTLSNIAKCSSKETSNITIKSPKQFSQKAMKALKSKSPQAPEDPMTPKSGTAPDNATRFTDHGAAWKKPKLSVSEKRDDTNSPRAPYSFSAPRSSRPSGPDANSRNHVNGGSPKRVFMAPPRRVVEKANHGNQKARKVDWSRGKNPL